MIAGGGLVPSEYWETAIVNELAEDGVSVLQSQQQAINLMMDSLGLNKPKENTDYRIYQIQVVSFCCIEIISQEILYLMDKEFQY